MKKTRLQRNELTELRRSGNNKATLVVHRSRVDKVVKFYLLKEVKVSTTFAENQLELEVPVAKGEIVFAELTEPLTEKLKWELKSTP